MCNQGKHAPRFPSASRPERWQALAAARGPKTSAPASTSEHPDPPRFLVGDRVADGSRRRATVAAVDNATGLLSLDLDDGCAVCHAHPDGWCLAQRKAFLLELTILKPEHFSAPQLFGRAAAEIQKLQAEYGYLSDDDVSLVFADRDGAALMGDYLRPWAASERFPVTFRLRVAARALLFCGDRVRATTDVKDAWRGDHGTVDRALSDGVGVRWDRTGELATAPWECLELDELDEDDSDTASL